MPAMVISSMELLPAPPKFVHELVSQQWHPLPEAGFTSSCVCALKHVLTMAASALVRDRAGA